MGNDDPKPLGERLKTIVQYRLAQVRGTALAGDYPAALDLLRFGFWRDLCAWGSELQSDEVIVTLPDLRAKWEGEAIAYLQAAFPALPESWADEVKRAGPGGAAVIYQGHQAIASAQFKAQVNVEAINTALEYLALDNPLRKRFEYTVKLLLAAPPVVAVEPREVAAKGSSNNGA